MFARCMGDGLYFLPSWITSRYYLVYIVYVCGCIPIRLFIVKQEMYLQVINRYKTSIWFLFLNQHKYKSFGDNHFFREIYSLSSCDFKEFSAFPSIMIWEWAIFTIPNCLYEAFLSLGLFYPWMICSFSCHN